MAIVNLEKMLTDAQNGNYAVPAVNITCWETFKALSQVTEEEKSPIIMSLTPKFLNFLGGDYICPAILKVASKMKVPVALHLDHGKSMEEIVLAIQNGFTSVMIDGSHLPFDENVQITSQVVKLAHSVGVSVEAELGSIKWDFARNEGYTDDLTDPDNAAEFVQKTHVDLLAVSVGNAHGMYSKPPKINHDILAEIQQKAKIPLVLHGGSGIKDVEKSIDLGVRKINVNSHLQVANREAISKVAAEVKTPGTFCDDFTTASINAMKEIAREYIRKFRANGTV